MGGVVIVCVSPLVKKGKPEDRHNFNNEHFRIVMYYNAAMAINNSYQCKTINIWEFDSSTRL